MQSAIDASYSSSYAGETAAQLAALRGDVAALVAEVGQLQGVAKGGAEVTADESRAVLNQVAALRGEMSSLLASQKQRGEASAEPAKSEELNAAVAQLGNLCEWTLKYCQEAAGGQASLASRLTELQEETGVVASAMRRLRGGLQVDVENAFKQIINEAAERQQQLQQQQLKERSYASPGPEEVPARRVPTPRPSPGVAHQRLREIRTPSTARRRPPPEELSELRRLLQEHRQLELAEAAERRPGPRRPTPMRGRESPAPRRHHESNPELQQQMQHLLEMQKMQLQLLAAVSQLQAPAAQPAKVADKPASESARLEEQLRELRRTQERQSELLEELRQQSLRASSDESRPAAAGAEVQVKGRSEEVPPRLEAAEPKVKASEIPDAVGASEAGQLARWQQIESQLSEMQAPAPQLQSASFLGARPAGPSRDAHQVYQELLQLQRLRVQLDNLELPQGLPRPALRPEPPAAATEEERPPAAQSLQIQFHPLPDRPMQLTIDSPSHSAPYEHLDMAQSPRLPPEPKPEAAEVGMRGISEHNLAEERRPSAPPAAIEPRQAPAPPPPAELARVPASTVMRRPCPPPPPPSVPPRFGAAPGEDRGETTQWSDLQLQLREQLEALRRRQQKQSDAEAEAGTHEDEPVKPEELFAESRAEFLKRQQDSLAERLRSTGLVGELTTSTSSSLQMSYLPPKSEDTEQRLESEPTSPNRAPVAAHRSSPVIPLRTQPEAPGHTLAEALSQLPVEDVVRSRASDGSLSFDGQEDCHNSFVLSPCGHLHDLPTADPPQPVCRPLMPAFSASTGSSLQGLPQESSREESAPPPRSFHAHDSEEFRPGVVKDLLAKAREALAAAKASQAVQAGSFHLPSTLRRSPPRGLGGSPSIGWQPPSPEPEVQRPSPQPHPSPAAPPSAPSAPSAPPAPAPAACPAPPVAGHRFAMWCTPEGQASTATDITLASPECPSKEAFSPPEARREQPTHTEPICCIVTPLQPDKE